MQLIEHVSIPVRAYYAALLPDPDGNGLEAECHQPQGEAP
jgi:hypothetical protein